MPPTDFKDLGSGILDVAKNCMGEDVTFKPKSGGSFNIRGIFDDSFEQIDPNTEKVVAGNQPVLGVNLRDFSVTIKKQDQFLIRNISYRVIDVQEDGVTGAMVFLHKVGGK